MDKTEKINEIGLKQRIILCHTSREANEYLASLKFRYNGKFNRIPHFLIERNGEIHKILEEGSTSQFFNDEELNKTSIIISLENLGWLEKKPLTSYYINWKGSIYNGDVYEKKWRDFFFWEPYPNSQIISLANLCVKLIESHKINKTCVGHNTKIDGIKKTSGIITKSNLDTRFTDLNPSFDFENFFKLIENEQYSQ